MTKLTQSHEEKAMELIDGVILKYVKNQFGDKTAFSKIQKIMESTQLVISKTEYLHNVLVEKREAETELNEILKMEKLANSDLEQALRNFFRIQEETKK